MKLKCFAARFSLLFVLFYLMLLLCGCDSSWVGQANNIISVLLPAVASLLAIVGSFVGIPPEALTAIQAWGAAAQDALTNIVKPAIDAYNAADADGKAALLVKIKAALDSIVTNLTQALTLVHVDDPSKQAKVAGIFALVQAMFVSLLNLIPVLEGKVTDQEKMHAAIHAVKPAKVFKSEFNTLAAGFGKQYEI